MSAPLRQTQPTPAGGTRPVLPGSPDPVKKRAPREKSRYSRRSRRFRRLLFLLLWGTAVILLFSLAAFAGGISGYRSAIAVRQASLDSQRFQGIVEQYQFGLLDQQAGRYEIARQRYEWVLAQDPGFPGAADRLAEVFAVLYATATPTPTPTATPTPTPTSTADLRPLEQLLGAAQAALAASDWDAAITAITDLRGIDPQFQVTHADGLLYRALRERGVAKILSQGDLEGGSYDLALAERFGPLDAEASNVREWARLYMYGSAFWGADPRTAVYYFSQVAAAAPYLRDATGWTASARLRASLLQFGDWLAKQEDWCASEEQYRLGLSYGGDAAIQPTLDYVYLKCYPPTATPSNTPTITLTPTVTLTETFAATQTSIPATPSPPTATPQPTDTATQPAVGTPPVTEVPTLPLPSETPPAPVETPTQPPPLATETPTPSQSPATEPPTPTPTETSPLPILTKPASP